MAPEYLFLAGLALLTLMQLRRGYRRQKDSSVEAASSNSLAEMQPTRQRAEPVELIRWQVEMHETARSLKAELDTKMGLLQQLIRIAESKRLELEQTIERADASDQAHSTDPVKTS